MAIPKHHLVADMPTNSFATLNPLDKGGQVNLSEGNLSPTWSGGAGHSVKSSMSFPKTGKWYAEVLAGNNTSIGLTNSSINSLGNWPGDSLLGSNSYGLAPDGRKVHGGSYETFLSNYASGSIIKIMFDASSGILQFGINSDSMTTAYTSISSNFDWFFTIGYWTSGGGTNYFNFGQNPTFSGNHTPSRIYTDASGYGEFAYEPPPGSMALCTANITPANILSAPYVVDETGNHSISVAGTQNVEISNKSPYLSDVDITLSPNARHTEMKSRASQNFKGGSYVFDGTSGLDIAASETTQLGAGDFTIEFWLYMNDITSQDYWSLVDLRSGVGETNAFGFFMYGNGDIPNGTLYVYSNGYYIFNQVLTNKTWHHVALVRQSGDLNCFLDGVKDSYGSFGNDISTTNNLSIGVSAWTTNFKLDGKIADFRVTKGDAVYKADFTPSTEPLQLEEGKDQILLQPWKRAISLGGYKQADESQENVKDYFKAMIWNSGKPNGYEHHVGFRPDFLWTQCYSENGNHWWVDSVRGAASGLNSGNTNAASGNLTEGYYSGYNGYNGFEDFTDNGFMVNVHAGGGEINYTTNDSRKYVGFLIRAGGKPSAEGKAKIDGVEQDCSDLMTGDLTLQPTKLSAGTKSGFSIVRFTSSGGKIPHGLGKAPNVIIFKGITGGGGWWMYHSSVNDPANNGMPFHDTSASLGAGGNFGGIADELGFYLGSSQSVVPGNQDTIAYCWASIPGFSSFGRYDANNSNDGPFINCGFRPKFVYLRSTGGSREGLVWDSSGRENGGSGIGPSDAMRVVSNAEPHSGVYADQIAFYNDGFKVVSNATPNVNNQSESYIYMAFADESSLGELGAKAKANPIVLNSQKGFKAVTWVGSTNGGVYNNGVVNTGMAADLVWLKDGNNTHDHQLYDSVRGEGKAISSNHHGAEHDWVANPQGGTGIGLSDFADNSFTVPTSGAAGGSGGMWGLNRSGNKMVAWCWKAGGAPTAVNNSDGQVTGNNGNSTYDLAGQVATDNSVSIDGELQTGYEYPAADVYPYKMSVNTKSGFSILHYRPNKTSSSNPVTIPHGLGKKPAFIIVKNLVNGSSNWRVYHHSLDQDKSMILNSANGQQSDTDLFKSCDEQLMTFGRNGNIMSTWTNSVDDYICYAWAEIPGYSKFGSYIGNGSGTDGPFVYTGFRPAFVIIKHSDTLNSWWITDSARYEFNGDTPDALRADESTSENVGNANIMPDYLSNGFKISGPSVDSAVNAGGSNYIYIAFAEQPYQLANAR